MGKLIAELTYSLIMCGCRNARIYSTSRCTLFFVLVVLITCFDKYFIATVCPVTVCIPTISQRQSVSQFTHSITHMERTLDFAERALGDLLHDLVLAQLGRGQSLRLLDVRHG